MYLFTGALRKNIWLSVGVFNVVVFVVLCLYAGSQISINTSHFIVYSGFILCLLYQLFFAFDASFKAEYFHRQIIGFKIAVRFIAIFMISFGLFGVFTVDYSDMNFENFLRYVAILEVLIILLPEIRCFLRPSHRVTDEGV